jgi:hypothetical protein
MHYQRGNNLFLLICCLVPVGVGLALFGYWYESGQPPWTIPISSLPFSVPDLSKDLPRLPISALQSGGIAAAAVVVGLLLGAWIVMSLVDLGKLGYQSLKRHHKSDAEEDGAEEIWTTARHG